MPHVAFIGLGNMGSGMAANLVKAGRTVHAFDLSQTALAKSVADGAKAFTSAAEAVKGAEAVVTMLPAGKHVRAVYEGEIFANAPKNAICSFRFPMPNQERNAAIAPASTPTSTASPSTSTIT